jgi:hypothetical protein
MDPKYHFTYINRNQKRQDETLESKQRGLGVDFTSGESMMTEEAQDGAEEEPPGKK